MNMIIDSITHRHHNLVFYGFSTLYCMRDSPFDVKWSEIEMPLGRNWDLDEQCEKEFGRGFKLCSRVSKLS